MSPEQCDELVLSEETAKSIVPRLELVRARGKLLAAIDHGGTRPRFGIFDETGKPILRLQGETRVLPGGIRLDLPTYQQMPSGLSCPKELPNYHADCLANWLKPLLSRVDYLGYAMAGPVTEDGVQINAPNIWGPEVSNVPWRALLETRLEMPGRIALGNDMWAAANDVIARGKRQKPPYDVNNFVIITVSSGIGSKVVRNRKVDLGVDGLAGEIGHLPILWPDELIPGRRCGCGRLYCLEAGSSGNSNAYRAKTEAERLLPLINTCPSASLVRVVAAISLEEGHDLDKRVGAINGAVVRAAKRGDSLAIHILRRTIRPIARAVAVLEAQLNVCNFYFVGGFALALGELFLRTLRTEMVAMGGISGRSTSQVMALGRLYNVGAHDWGLRGAALGAKLALDAGV